MLANLIGFILGFFALVGAGLFSYTYLEHTIGPRTTSEIVSVQTTKATTTPVRPVSTTTKIHTPALKVVTTTVVKKVNTVATSTNEQIIAPGPLRKPVSVVLQTSASTLSLNGVLFYTNKARAENAGLPPLAENATLDRDAQMKLDDMFAKQYFAHESPTGVGPGDLARSVGYTFIVVGENLALGDFDGDKGLVDAWMASPGHRANILNAQYQEIGIAVGKGMYEGRETWLAVQSFGVPLSACPAIDTGMKAQITTNSTEIAAMRAVLNDQKTQIDATPQNDPNYNEYVAKFNALVPIYNAMVETNRVLVATFNTQVQAFNACVNAVTH
ncbi:MAG: hypothetical protein UY07_C0001G0002 [Parcubacteria group bacterium GW2011_GWA1_47_8]|nr:MAG: hypothetical protein UY07_C0001G0002 [Parcubacteria group bacterium GW2011_GWA1_47_8]KKW07215.1 MAG: hypothetical protein UY42_C0016G0002 [Parcubacteria group bacterium GW2011_GWA2_49_16]